MSDTEGLTPFQQRQLLRMVKPFPARRVSDALYHVITEAHLIEQAVFKLQLEPPDSAEAWRYELDTLEGSLMSLQARCRDARPVLERLADQADGDVQRGLSALVAILRGLPVDEPVPA